VKAKAFVGASVLAAVAASMCWFLPIVFVTMGVGVVGAELSLRRVVLCCSALA
jgi:hypothetical protein